MLWLEHFVSFTPFQMPTGHLSYWRTITHGWPSPRTDHSKRPLRGSSASLRVACSRHFLVSCCCVWGVLLFCKLPTKSTCVDFAADILTSMYKTSSYSKLCFSCLFGWINFRADRGALAQILLQVLLLWVMLLHTVNFTFPVCQNKFQGRQRSTCIDLGILTMGNTSSGVVFIDIVKCCINIAFFGCITVCKITNTDWTSYGSLVAAASVHTRSTSKLHVISAMATHSSPACITKSSQWRAESGQLIKCASCHKFWSVMRYPPSPPSDSCAFSTLSVLE